ncbi:MAG TPA: TonB-dependent receptor, partial [Gammaproteobacteria bacterium]|nr:TonB-dependent receptor [Gammaproteobacteria bacterium]
MQLFRRPYRLACCAAPPLAVGTAALAQEPAKTRVPLEEIVVTATLLERTLDKTPAAVSVVTEDDIQRARQQLGLDESLNRVPGLFMQN